MDKRKGERRLKKESEREIQYTINEHGKFIYNIFYKGKKFRTLFEYKSFIEKEIEQRIIKIIETNHRKWSNSDFDEYYNDLILKIKGDALVAEGVTERGEDV